MKKKIVFTILCLLTCTAAWSQNMRVVSFRLLENDMTANRHGTSEQDENGETAALVKMVTTETGFVFDGGSLGIVKTVQKPGEWWVYVPRHAQRITISHPSFGVLRSYVYPVPIEGGRTYEMLLDLGIGRFVTINSFRAGADIEIDGQYAGKAPVYNRYLLYGKHTLKATLGKLEGTLDYLVSPNSDVTERMPVVNIPMQDQSAHYGQGRVSVDNNAEIYYADRLVGTGTWDFDLREGVYEVETRKANCDPERTTITVKPGRQGNDVKVKAPIPHMGRLSIYSRTRNITATDNGQPIDLSEVHTLPVGTHQIDITRKGYVPLQQEYTIVHNETTRDTVQLERITYVKPLAFYFGGGYTLRALSGVSGMLGAVIKGHDLQLGYTFGLASSDVVHWYGSDAGSSYLSAVSYKMNSLTLKYGYQFNLMRQLAITPQLGYSLDQLSGTIERGTTLYGDGSKAHCMTLGVKLLLVPVQHVYLFATPEFGIALKKGPNFETIADVSNVQAGGFAATLGLLVSF